VVVKLMIMQVGVVSVRISSLSGLPKALRMNPDTKRSSTASWNREQRPLRARGPAQEQCQPKAEARAEQPERTVAQLGLVRPLA